MDGATLGAGYQCCAAAVENLDVSAVNHISFFFIMNSSQAKRRFAPSDELLPCNELALSYASEVVVEYQFQAFALDDANDLAVLEAVARAF